MFGFFCLFVFALQIVLHKFNLSNVMRARLVTVQIVPHNTDIVRTGSVQGRVTSDDFTYSNSIWANKITTEQTNANR